MSHAPFLRRPLRRLARVAAAGALAVATWSCGGATDPASAPVAAVALSDTAVVLRLGDETALVARPQQVSGDELVGRRIFWSSRDPGVVDVSQSGVIRAVAVGSTQVAANVEGRSALATVTVLPRAIATVQIDPATLQLAVGARQRLTARTLNDAGAAAPVTVTWQSLSPDVVSVSADGEITALRAGTGSVRATAEGVTATAAVVVTPVPVAAVAITPAAPTLVVGSTVQLTATPRDAAGTALGDRTVAWSSRDPGVAVVSSTGQVTGLATGSAVIVAVVEGREATTTVTVQTVPAARVVVTPDQSTIGVTGTIRLAPVVTDAAGNVLGGRTATFTSSAPGVAQVSADGTVTGISAGVATITATVEGVNGTATVRVLAAAGGSIASVAVTPGTATLTVGDTRSFAVTVRAGDGSIITGRPVTWSSGSPSVLTVSSTGVVTAVAPGTAQVLAQVDGITGAATVTVQRVPVAAVQVTPSAASVATGAFAQLAATPRDAAGNALAGRTVTWSSANEAVATVTSDGRVLGVAPGTATIRATSEGVTGTATVTVTAVVRVSPATVTLRDRGNGNRTAQLVATDQAGRVLPAAEVTWRSSDTGVATVDATGLVRGISSGSGTATATITATYRGVSATATVTVIRD